MSIDELRLMVAADMRPAGRWLTDEQRAQVGLMPLTDDERALVEWAREEPVEAQRVATGVERRPRRGKEI